MEAPGAARRSGDEEDVVVGVLCRGDVSGGGVGTDGAVDVLDPWQLCGRGVPFHTHGRGRAGPDTGHVAGE